MRSPGRVCQNRVNLYSECMIIFLMVFIFFAFAVQGEEPPKPPRIGNFSLRPSQQPLGLVAFGGNIIDKDQILWSVFATDYEGKKNREINIDPNVVLGISDVLSLNLNFPFTPESRQGSYRSSGLEDFFAQIEYAFYSYTTSTYEDMATLVANVSFPTGSTRKAVPTGIGAPSLFLAATYFRTYVDWILFTSQGMVLTDSYHKTKYGNQFLYQLGMGRNFPSPEGWIYAWIFEVDGTFTQKNRIKGRIDCNSGGNIVLATPSLWISSNDWIFQLGVSIPLSQHLFGKQRKTDYVLNFNVGWTP